jgi:hypothetical protein
MQFSGDRRQILGLLVDLRKQPLNAADLTFFEEGFTAVCTDPGQDCIKREVKPLRSMWNGAVAFFIRRLQCIHFMIAS